MWQWKLQRRFIVDNVIKKNPKSYKEISRENFKNRPVKDRIKEKADYLKPVHPDHRPPYVHLIPLAEIISKAVDQKNPFTKKVTNIWRELINAFGSEINVLLDVDISEISKITIPAVADAIKMFRDKKVIIIPGGGGEYGKIKLPSEEEMFSLPVMSKDKQTSLFEYK